MSSFILSAKHFNSIENSIFEIAKNNLYFKSIFFENCDDLKEIKTEISKIVDKWRTTNVLCVCFQYKHHYEGSLDLEIKTNLETLLRDKTEFITANLPQLYMLLQSLDYQCELEHIKGIYENTDFDKLESFKNWIAKEFITNSQDYKQSEWSI